jgi:hypothetical protein
LYTLGIVAHHLLQMIMLKLNIMLYAGVM